MNGREAASGWEARAHGIARAVGEWQSLECLSELQDRILRDLTRILPVDEAVLAAVSRRRVVAEAATAVSVAQYTDVQSVTGEGPCLDAARTAGPVVSDDLTVETRWPSFCARATAADIRSVMAVPLVARGARRRTLTLYSAKPMVFTRDVQSYVRVFAPHIAVLLAGAREVMELQAALRNRDLIGQAKGILMQCYGVNEEDAFRMLRAHSQHSNVKLRDVALRLVNRLDRNGVPEGVPTSR